MRRIARLLTVLAVPSVALSLAAAPANAADPVKATLTVDTDAAFAGNSVTITATGYFSGGIIANSTVAVQAAGTETYTSRGVLITTPIACHGESVHFSSSNAASCTIPLHSADSIVEVVWTGEGVGLAPTPFAGTCAGSATRSGPGSELIVKTC